MSEYEETLILRASPGAVFNLVADPANLPRFLPTLRRAEANGPDRVHIVGEAAGHPYDGHGRFHADRAARRIEWGSDEGGYAGWLEVRAAGAAAAVTAHLSFTGGYPQTAPGEGPSEDEIREGLRHAIAAIGAALEDR